VDVVLGMDFGGTKVAVGVSTIGIPLDNGVDLAPAIPGWDNTALARSIEGAFGVAIRVATDVKTAATAEAWWGALAGYDPAIYLDLGTGLGAAVVVEGRVLLAAHGAAGEIGYNLVDPSHAGLEIGARPMLKHTVSGIGLTASGSRLLGRFITAGQVFHAAQVDPEVDSLVSALIASLSPHLVNLVTAVDAARVAIGGGFARYRERLQGPLEHALKSGVPYPRELVMAAYPFDAPLAGALALGAEAAGASLPHGAYLSASQPWRGEKQI
jgi:glucokinase